MSKNSKRKAACWNIYLEMFFFIYNAFTLFIYIVQTFLHHFTKNIEPLISVILKKPTVWCLMIESRNHVYSAPNPFSNTGAKVTDGRMKPSQNHDKSSKCHQRTMGCKHRTFRLEQNAIFWGYSSVSSAGDILGFYKRSTQTHICTMDSVGRSQFKWTYP